MNDSVTTATLLSDLAVIEATGTDTAAFLHGQLSNDITGLTEGQACLAAYCTPKGRMLASMVVWKVDSEPDPVYRMLIKPNIAAAIVKRLSMFVLRAKVKLALSENPVIGVWSGQSGGALPPELDATLSGLQDLSAYQVANTTHGSFISAPRADQAKARFWFVPHTALATTALDNPDLAALWAADDIAAGLPWIDLSTQEMFIPQTLNLELIGGVSFTKGCYPGQEVVARSHYRGTVKRRMTRGIIAGANIDANTLPGQDTFDAHAPEAAVGRIVNAAQFKGQVHVLLEVQLSDIGHADLRLGTPDGAQIRLLDLPYDINPPKD